MRESYICILDWMVKELKLSGNELLVFAIIHGFSQDGECAFVGSKQYICDRLNITKPTAIKCIDNLIEKGYVYEQEETINGFKRIRYGVCKEILRGVKNLNEGVKNLNGGSKETLPNNKEENKDIININKEKFRKESVSFREQDLEEKEEKPLDVFAKAEAKKLNYEQQMAKWLEEINDEEWRKVVAKWLEYKYREKNDRYKDVGFRRMCTYLHTLSNGNVYLADAIVQESMVNNYKGLFPPRKEMLERFNNNE